MNVNLNKILQISDTKVFLRKMS